MSESSTVNGPPSLGELQDLDASGVKEAAELLAASFVSSPAYHYVFEALNESQRLEALTFMFQRNLEIFLAGGKAKCKCVYSNTSPQELVCFFVLQPPDAKKVSLMEMVAHGLLTFPFRFGWQATRRLFEVIDFHDAADSEYFKHRRDHLHLTTRLWLLERMAVRPGWQGHGLGTKYLGEALELLTANGHGIFLNTQEPRNVNLYSRLGFEVCQTKEYFEMVDGKRATNHSMVREPPAASKDENVASKK